MDKEKIRIIMCMNAHGMNNVQISKALGISHDYIWKIVHRYNGKVNGRGWKCLLTNDEAEIVAEKVLSDTIDVPKAHEIEIPKLVKERKKNKRCQQKDCIYFYSPMHGRDIHCGYIDVTGKSRLVWHRSRGLSELPCDCKLYEGKR